MTRSLLKATTALSVCLAVAQPMPLMAQGAVVRPMVAVPRLVHDTPLWRVQTCADDPTLPDCPAPAQPGTEGTTPPGADQQAPAADASPAEPQAEDALPTAPPEQIAPAVDAAPAPAMPDAPAEAPATAPGDQAAPAEAPVPETAPAPEPPTAEAAPAPVATGEAPAADQATEPATDAPAVIVAPEATTPPAPAVEPPADGTTTAPEAAAPTQDNGAEVQQPAQPPATEETPKATDPEVIQPAPEVIPAAPTDTTDTAPEATAPDATAPDATAPEATAPDATAPETTAPDATTTEATTPEVTESETTAPEVPAAPEATVTEEVPPVADPVPEPTAEQTQVLETLMADPEVAAAVETLSETVQPPATTDGTAAADPAALAAVAALGGTAPAPTDTTTQTLGATEARTSTQDFTTPVITSQPTQVQEDDDKGLTDLQKAGLLALGAVAVGMLINNNRVVANSGDRVVVDRGNGDLAIWKDDNANLRAPGVVETTDRYRDGSTLTRLDRPDGTQIVTVRDATGRVVRRDLVRNDGSTVPIIDDTRRFEPVRVSQLPRPRVQTLRFADDSDPATLRALLDDAQQQDLGRTFSLSQVRDIRQLRDLAPELTGNPITFATGSSAIRPEEARKLARIAALMRDLIDENPGEVFLIEGHTDAVGGAAANLALSDRRAESIALALTEIFGVPAENMIVQGYGERYLKVQTPDAEPLNRRVALRRITWLLDGA